MVDINTSDYIFFIDESFLEWFSLARQDADFCHAGISVPRNKLHDLSHFVNSLQKNIFTHYQKKYPLAKDAEIKSQHLYALGQEFIESIADKIAYFCQKNHCFVFGFYSSLDPLLNNLLRDKYFEYYHGNIADYTDKIEEEKEEIRKELLEKKRNGKYDVELLKDSYLKITQFAMHFHHKIKKTFIIQYDPRQKKEDRLLNQKALDMADNASKAIFHEESVLLGFDASISSEKSPGLFLADLICADIRTLFRKHSELLKTESALEILSAKYNDKMLPAPRDYPLPFPFYPKLFPRAIIQQIIADKELLFARLYNHLANNTISCYASNGEARHIDFNNCAFFDMAD